MLVDIPQGKGRGHWQRVIIDEFGDEPVWSAIIWCPDCGRILALQRGHRIAEDGSITPSVGHPASYAPCGWHTCPRLVGWQPEPNPAPKPISTCESCGATTRGLGGWGTWSGGPGLICTACITTKKEGPANG